MMLQAVTRPADRLLTGGRVLAVVACYLAVLLALRLLLFPGASEDDAEQMFFAQAWAWGYKANQPPLYTWFVRAAETVLGPSRAAVSGVKFALLFALSAFVGLAARRVVGDARLSALAAVSVFGLYFIAWESVMNYSHSVLLAAVVAATLHALLRLEDRDRIADYAWLGIVVATGVLAKYNYPLYLVPLLAAALADSVLRRRLLSWKTLAATVLAVGLVAPHLHWALTDPGGLTANAEAVPRGEAGDTAWNGLGSAIVGTLSFTLPLMLILVATFPRAFRSLPRNEPESDETRRRRLLSRAFWIFAVIAVAAIVAFDVSKVRVNWLLGLAAWPVYMIARAKSAGTSPRAVAICATIVFLVALLVPAAMSVRAVTGPDTCRKCNFFVPYPELAQQIRGDGFEQGAIVAVDRPNQIGGNLRRFFPDAVVASTRYRNLRPEAPSGSGSGRCLLVWNTTASAGRQQAVAWAVEVFGVDVPDTMATRTAEAPIAGADDRRVRLEYLIAAC